MSLWVCRSYRHCILAYKRVTGTPRRVAMCCKLFGTGRHPIGGDDRSTKKFNPGDSTGTEIYINVLQGGLQIFDQTIVDTIGRPVPKKIVAQLRHQYLGTPRIPTTCHQEHVHQGLKFSKKCLSLVLGSPPRVLADVVKMSLPRASGRGLGEDAGVNPNDTFAKGTSVIHPAIPFARGLVQE